MSWGFERMEYKLTPEAIELGLDAVLPAVFELTGQIGEFGRGERARGFTIQVSVRIESVVVDRTARARSA